MEPTLSRATVHGLDVAYLEAGTGPLAVCLHGFPDSAYTWRHLLPALADAGYHAVAPFLRGYAPTAVPTDGASRGALAMDACGLHEVLGGDGDAVLIGHDWGAMATYVAGAWQPERWRRLVAAAVPPPGALAEGFFSYDQLRRSWYIFFFQTPLAEMAVGMDDLAFIDRLWADWSPGFDAAEEVAHVKDSLRDPANLACAISYYRTMLGTIPADPEHEAIAAKGDTPPSLPTLYLHGATDGCLGVELATKAADHLPAPGSRMEVVEGAGHFLQLERPDEVNRLIVDFLGEDR